MNSSNYCTVKEVLNVKRGEVERRKHCEIESMNLLPHSLGNLFQKHRLL